VSLTLRERGGGPARRSEVISGTEIPSYPARPPCRSCTLAGQRLKIRSVCPEEAMRGGQPAPQEPRVSSRDRGVLLRDQPSTSRFHLERRALGPDHHSDRHDGDAAHRAAEKRSTPDRYQLARLRPRIRRRRARRRLHQSSREGESGGPLFGGLIVCGNEKAPLVVQDGPRSQLRSKGRYIPATVALRVLLSKGKQDSEAIDALKGPERPLRTTLPVLDREKNTSCFHAMSDGHLRATGSGGPMNRAPPYGLQPLGPQRQMLGASLPHLRGQPPSDPSADNEAGQGR
jgi:hypothetical protein